MSRNAFRVMLTVVCALNGAACGDDDEGTKRDGPPADTGRPADAGTPADTGTAGDRAPEAAAGDAARDTAAGDAVAPDGAGGDRSADGPPAEAGTPDAGLTAQQARGKYLVDHVSACPDCHTPHNAMGMPEPGKYLSGWECIVRLPNGSCLHTRNLTNHETGLKNRSADEIKKMMLDGIRPAATGDVPLNPFMPYYVFHNMTAADADAIVAYLRTVTPVDHMVPRKGMEFDVPRAASFVDPGTIPLPADSYPEKEAAMRGRYLTSQAGLCIECHTKHNPPGTADVISPANFFAGGEEFPFGFPVTPVSKNITPDMTTGIGAWSLEDIRRVLREGMDRDDRGICPPMPVGPMGAFGGLTRQDMTDIAHYLKSMPPKSNMIVDKCSFPFPPPPPADAGPDAAAPTPDGGAADAPAGADDAGGGG